MASPLKDLKLLRFAAEQLRPGESLYTTVSPNHATTITGREGIDCNIEKVLIIEDYKTSNPKIIKAIKITFK